MQGMRDGYTCQLCERQVITIPAPSSNISSRSISTHRVLCLTISGVALNGCMLRIRASTWVDKTNADGFKLGKSYVWGEPLPLLRQCIDWEIVAQYEQFPHLLVQGMGTEITLVWTFDLPGRNQWPEKEVVLDFVRLGEMLARRFEVAGAARRN
jgi:hypothetical protein